jgi:hypothetical protein
VIFFSHQQSSAPVIDRFRNSTVARRNHWQSGRHRFQNRVRHSFLILIRGYFARMQKQVRTRIEIKESRLRQKADKMHVSKNPKSAGKHL